MPGKTIGKARDLRLKWTSLHSSSVNISGKALLFLGHSTAGKSTISRLLSERYPVIADDKVWVRRNHKGVWVVRDGSDNSRADNCCDHRNDFKEYPILGVVRIFKSNSKKIIPISPKRICKFLMDAVFEIDFQRQDENLNRKKLWFSCMGAVSRRIQGWSLTFANDKSIIKEVCNVFEERQAKMINAGIKKGTSKE